LTAYLSLSEDSTDDYLRQPAPERRLFGCPPGSRDPDYSARDIHLLMCIARLDSPSRRHS
jgi:hypothetical protein